MFVLLLCMARGKFDKGDSLNFYYGEYHAFSYSVDNYVCIYNINQVFHNIRGKYVFSVYDINYLIHYSMTTLILCMISVTLFSMPEMK